MHFNTIQQCGAVFSKNINNIKSWTELLRQNRRSIFQWKNPSPPNQCCSQRLRLLATKLGQIQHWYSGVRGRICNLKNWVIYWIYWIFNFVSTSFVQGCRKHFRNNKHKFTKYGRFMIMEQLRSVETASTKIFKLKLIKRETFLVQTQTFVTNWPDQNLVDTMIL